MASITTRSERHMIILETPDCVNTSGKLPQHDATALRAAHSSYIMPNFFRLV